MKTVVVREYARLTTDTVENNLDQAHVSVSAFEWLCNLSSGFSKSGATLLQVENRRWLKLDNFVGVLETPCGTVIEILPKHTESRDAKSQEESRLLLIKMLETALDLPVRSTDRTDLMTFQHPLLEWVMKQFLLSLDHLVKRGIRFDYRRVDEEQRYLRGQLDRSKQLRQPLSRSHLFNIRHDLYLPDRPENRLLKSALMRICRSTQQPDSWRLSHELAGLLQEIPDSKDIQSDFGLWHSERLMAHYQAIRPWCELVLGQHMPLALRGRTHGISLLFPMEKLFERYVEVKLKLQLRSEYRLKAQAASYSLCEHGSQPIFQLRPDLVVRLGKQNIALLDAKWKLIDSSNREKKYNLSQSDFYQLFAYGQKYLGGSGHMALIYPRTINFELPLPEFDFGNGLILHVLPFDLKSCELIGAERLGLPFQNIQSSVAA